MTTVTNQDPLDCRFSDVSGEVEMELLVSGTWTPTAGNVTDEITASSSITEVTTRFQPASGYEQRMRFKPDGDTVWGSWSAWTTSRISHDTGVPSSGQSTQDDFEVEIRPTAGGPDVGVGGYIKVKKLDS